MQGIGKGPLALARKIEVDESCSKRVVAFLGREFSQPRIVLELASTKKVFVEWVHQTPELRVAVDRKPSILTITDPFPADPMIAEQEALAVSARDAAGGSEFRISGSLRTSWYEAQRKDPSLAGNIRRPEAPSKISGDGVLEREVTLRTGQVVSVVVVSNGIAGANGGAHRSAEVTYKLLERAVWWPDMEKDIKTWVSHASRVALGLPRLRQSLSSAWLRLVGRRFRSIAKAPIVRIGKAIATRSGISAASVMRFC